MEKLNLLQNKLILETEKNSIDKLPRHKNLSSGLKTIRKTQPRYRENGVYNNRFVFDIDKRFNNLSQLYLKVTGTFDGATTAEDPSPSYFLKSIVLRTKKNVVIQEIRSNYTFTRTEQLITTQTYTLIKKGLSITSPSETFDFFVPLYFFFSDSDDFLKTRKLEDLELVVITNDTKDSMGIDNDITSINLELHSVYFDSNDSKKLPLLGPITGDYSITGYNTYYEEDKIIPSGSTSFKTLLNCGHPLFSLTASVRLATTGEGVPIKVMRLYQGDSIFVELDFRINYTFLGSEQSFIEAGSFTYFFSKLKSRLIDSGLITFNTDMYPIYLEVEFDTLVGDHKLSVFEEYRTKFDVDKYGDIHLSDDHEIIDKTFKYIQENVTTSI